MAGQDLTALYEQAAARSAAIMEAKCCMVLERLPAGESGVTSGIVLAGVAGIVTRNTRVSDVPARWGGEEFMILIAEGDIAVAASVAEKLRQAIASHRFDGIGQVKASFGVATLMAGDDMNSFLKRVDDALYVAKTNGRNRVETM